MTFKDKLIENGSYPLRARGIDILQVSLGYKCNMACKYCHVQGGPLRKELMDRDTVDAVLDVFIESGIQTLDLTGGAPEINPHFRYILEQTRGFGRHVIVRSNLTIFYEDGMEDLPEFYRDVGVGVIASLPYYIEEYADRVRGNGVFKKSIDALRRLNSLGYGRDEKLKIDLVYNSYDAFLPPSQDRLREEYKRELKGRFGIVFNSLLAFNNMPLGRFRRFLERLGNLDRYQEMLVSAFNPGTLCGLMCRRLISVGWDGRLHDCDFNQVTGIGLSEGYRKNIKDFDLDTLSGRVIAVDDHCFGCTAGQGST
ncbi:antilisterial bacteriocin subtilosin biosynthesis protein AlbA [bacterium BMS3Bbin06]|nr:antilisterial bacteriocin subtilosin biosynthesis protein AlbA [bacterium BMS3Abin08]GBE34689.1 antilisterial bacteriocin subtilosin biosynthesis protein AlbA [bacterium BMS3Bbin06]HDO36519.1 radical SAM/Cys-rich domain protein [Nitrospirota bacterium]